MGENEVRMRIRSNMCALENKKGEVISSVSIREDHFIPTLFLEEILQYVNWGYKILVTKRQRDWAKDISNLDRDWTNSDVWISDFAIHALERIYDNNLPREQAVSKIALYVFVKKYGEFPDFEELSHYEQHIVKKSKEIEKQLHKLYKEVYEEVKEDLC